MFVNSVIISECHSEDGATQVIERRCTVDVEAPRLLKRVLHLLQAQNAILMPNSIIYWT